MSLLTRVGSWLGLGGGRAAAGPTPPAVRGRYDNSITTPENQRNWWATDYLSAKAANHFQVRRILRMRSRYEVANNPYLFGVVNNNADDLIGTGPTLQVLTESAEYNREVETAWREWADEVGLVEKLRTQKLARTVDGEGFLVLRTVRDLESPVKLYPADIEADQVTTFVPKDLDTLWLDGITLHPDTGRPKTYSVLKHHPGDYFFPDMNPLAAETISARWVLHWFPKFRPGQIRGVPVFTPSLDLFTELRAFRRATLGAAELAADMAAVLEQDVRVGAFAGEDTDNELEAFKRVPIDRKMMTTLPPGAKLSQFKSEHPATTYEMFQEKCLGEACRPLAYPLNLVLGTSQKFNFSSAKLDHTNYRYTLGVERADCDRVTLNPLFRAWYPEAVLSGRIRAYRGLDTLPPCAWHWPGFEPLDPFVDAQADQLRLSAGQDTYRDFWARRGYDWRDVLAQQSDEKKELERLGLEFGDPMKRTQTNTDEENGKPGKKPGKPAAAAGHDPIRAFDESKVKRDDHGRFSETGSAHDSPKELAGRADHLLDKIRKYGGKAVAAAKAVKTKAYELAVRATWAVQSGGIHADDILDTAHDYSKIINAKGTGDWLSADADDDDLEGHLGVGGNTAAVIGSHVLAYGIVRIKEAIARRRAEKAKAAADGDKPEPLTDEGRAKAATEVLRELLPALGCPKRDLPTEAEVLRWVKKHHHDPKAEPRAEAASVA